jgi:hypothetical protein
MSNIVVRHFAMLCVAVLLAAIPGTARAQQARSCNWDECALRIKAPTLSTPATLVRGREAVEVVRLGLFEPAVAPFVTLSDSAVAHAQVYDVMFDRGSMISLAGTAIAIAAPILFRSTMKKIAWTGVGLGVSFYGGYVTNRANEALSEAIWWYNRELQRGQAPDSR